MPQFRVTASALRLREAPSVQAATVATLPRDTIVDGAERSADGNWRHVQVAGGQRGWMSDGFLAPATGALSAVPDAPWMAFAEAELAAGVVEIPGPENNPRIVEYHQATDLEATDDETPWCSAFVNWCMKQAGVARTNSAAARSWLSWGKALAAPEPGCVTVLRRGDDPTKGHVAFFVDADGAGHIRLLGGNQGNAVSIRSFPIDRVLSHRWPA